ncbi:MAG: hypothetical protein AB1779_11425 [Candidatus Thermoplasmatota archaeon]
MEMKQDASLVFAKEIMIEFAYLTGISSNKKQKRYLWTDAFAVCNFLELYRQTKDEKYRQLALSLVDQVHHVLGKHRDNSREGWISGLDEGEGEKHPTKGGLRIGKELNERKPKEPFDEILEWERDGQYYHYLTKWMHALNRVSRETGDLTYNRLAIELAKVAHSAFTYVPSSGGKKRMYWKMSIDLSRPLVPSMGQHDPLDGLITYKELQATAQKFHSGLDLSFEISDMESICEGKDWTTSDPLGIGDLLCNSYKIAQLVIKGCSELSDLLLILLRSSNDGLEAYLETDPLELPSERRLAFRELGLSIGLKAAKRTKELIKEIKGLFDEHLLHSKIESLLQYAYLTEKIERFWLENKESESWREHLDINMVMLATSLIPDGYLRI